jgi:hypothetical protein
MRMALIQGMENGNKTMVRIDWHVNGGFLEGVKWLPLLNPLLLIAARSLCLNFCSDGNVRATPRSRLGEVVIGFSDSAE